MRAFAVEFKADPLLISSRVNTGVYNERLFSAARQAGFSAETYGRIGEVALPVLTRRREVAGAPEIYLSAGVHGNEPAGPMALLELLRRLAFPEGLNYTLFPLVNPVGMAAGTRENGDGIDLNRDYGFVARSAETRAQLAWIGEKCFDLVICLHEDHDGEGFYLYAHCEDSAPHDYPALALQAAEPWTGIDPREEIDAMPARDGLMSPPPSVVSRERPDLPEALRLHFHHGSRFTFTTETPSRLNLANRIGAQCAVVSAILNTFADDW